MRGGYRPGAGRKKGAKDKAPRGTPNRDYSETEAAKRRQLLALGDVAKLKFYQDQMQRIKAGDKLTVTEMKYLDQIKADLSDPEERPTLEVPEGADPLAYMLGVMNDPRADQETRLRAASLAAPYIHPRKGEGTGKKEEKNERAKQAATGGKFASMGDRLRVVK